MFGCKYIFMLETVINKSKKIMSIQISRKSRVAVIQMNVQNNKEKNFQQFINIFQKINSNIKMIFLPEAFDFIGENIEETISLAEKIEGPLIERYRQFAKDHNLWISLGGFHEPAVLYYKTDGKIYNTHLLINSLGNIISKYRKIHLFDIKLPEKNFSALESSYTLPGNQIVAPVQTPIGKLGLAVCYDVRFPEIGSILRNLEADIITYPSAFSVYTGPFHWHALLQTRAIETQCYVIAAAQIGCHNNKRCSYGHSLIVDPWGKIISESLSDGPDVIEADIDIDYLNECRKNMPIIEHRRSDIYIDIHQKDSINDFKFGDNIINNSIVFFESKFSFAFVNRKPVVPGHVLVSSKHEVARFSDLQSFEVSDLFLSVQKISKVVEHKFGAPALTIAIQDGPEAGQTVSHVHVHILPRKGNDFQNNDDVYEKLEKNDKSEMNFRSFEEMTAESLELKTYFCN